MIKAPFYGIAGKTIAAEKNGINDVDLIGCTKRRISGGGPRPGCPNRKLNRSLPPSSAISGVIFAGAASVCARVVAARTSA